MATTEQDEAALVYRLIRSAPLADVLRAIAGTMENRS
jgi:hypothetical protein